MYHIRLVKKICVKLTVTAIAISASLIASVSYYEVSTLAGDGTDGFVDGHGEKAKFSFPYGVANIGSDVYVTDSGNNRIRRIDEFDKVSTIAGCDMYGFADGLGKDAKFSYPCGITSDNLKTLYVADTFNSRVRKITLKNHHHAMVSTIAGDGTPGFAEGLGESAQFNYPFGITRDGSGNLYVADSSNDKVRKIDGSTSEVTTIAGGDVYGFAEEAGKKALFNYPCGITSDQDDNLYVVDTFNRRIRKIDTSFNVTTIAGGTTGFSDGSKASAKFRYPYGIACDALGNIYIADTNNHSIRKIDASFNVTTIAGTGVNGFADGPGKNAQFNCPYGIACDSTGKNIYVADTTNHRIRKLTFHE